MIVSISWLGAYNGLTVNHSTNVDVEYKYIAIIAEGVYGRLILYDYDRIYTIAYDSACRFERELADVKLYLSGLGLCPAFGHLLSDDGHVAPLLVQDHG